MNKIQKLKDGREFLTKNGTFIPEEGEGFYYIFLTSGYVKVLPATAIFDYEDSFNNFKTKEDAEKAAVIIRAALGE